jgi:anti-sigma factor RsiW
MAANLNNEKLIAEYLLGELPEEQQVEIENRAFADKEYLASITAVENDLIDEYVRNELSQTQRQRFESRFLASAERRKRVAFAKALAGVTSPAPVVETARQPVVASRAVSWRASLEAFIGGLIPVPRFAMGVAMVVVLGGSLSLLGEMLRLRSQLHSMRAESQSRQNALQQQVESERRRSEELVARLNQEKQQREQTDESLRQLSETPETPAPKPVIVALTLLPGLARGAGDKPRLALPENARLVRLNIGVEPEEPYKTYSVELRTVSGRSVWNGENLTARDRRGARAIGLTLPATVVKPGEYELTLKGVAEGGRTEDVGFFYFTVQPQKGTK